MKLPELRPHNVGHHGDIVNALTAVAISLSDGPDTAICVAINSAAYDGPQPETRFENALRYAAAEWLDLICADVQGKLSEDQWRPYAAAEYIMDYYQQRWDTPDFIKILGLAIPETLENYGASKAGFRKQQWREITGDLAAQA